MSTFAGKVALVTGGNSGIGYATAQELIGQGATVIITGRRKDAVERAASELGAHGFVANQGKVADINQLALEVNQQFGQVDILFINAGVAFFAPIVATTESQFDDIVDVNFKGTFFTLAAFIPSLRDGASVVLLSSNGASMALPNSAAYAASKAALNSLTKSAAVELAPRQIRVNTVSPGPTQTDMMTKFGLDEATLTQMKASITTQVPLARMGTAQDVANLVVYLSGESASFITGAEFVIDGGMML